MLNWAARYFPILRALKQQLSRGDSLLEIGSGSVGIGKFRSDPFIGCDVYFPERPKAPMLPIVASAGSLPFDDRAFDAVVVSDVLEHVPPEERMAVIREALRVVRKIAIFGFPSGVAALNYDVRLAELYDRKQQARPEWLQEHLRYQPYPTADLFEDVQREWAVSSFDNENVAFHDWVMRREMSPWGLYTFLLLLATLPRLMEYLLQRADREPCYRKIVVVKPREEGK
jgi:SAM-dependent methyltransferase